jgi:pyridoxine/pyridoxamine 5'-phosphate oxidase
VTGTAADPLGLLLRDRQTAREREDPCANLCTLANVDGDGLPQARTLVLREIERRLAVFVNATSPKFPFLDDATVSVVVWLPSISIQYRLACATTLVEPAVVAQSWQLRPDPPKHMDWFYTQQQSQSSPIESREALLERLAGQALPEPLVAPDTARGFYLEPRLIERLDLAQDNGIHDRRRYLPGNPGGWRETVLVP